MLPHSLLNRNFSRKLPRLLFGSALPSPDQRHGPLWLNLSPLERDLNISPRSLQAWEGAWVLGGGVSSAYCR